jgi:hypothetical protein
MVLPTVAFILGAYGIYAFCTAWPWRQGQPGRGLIRRRAWARIGLWGGLAAGLSLLAWFSLPSGEQEPRFQLASFLGLTWQDGWAASQEVKPVEPLPVKPQKSGEQPVYALLHPSAPPVAAAPDKKKAPALKPLPKAKAKKAASKTSAKTTKNAGLAAKQDKPGLCPRN